MSKATEVNGMDLLTERDSQFCDWALERKLVEHDQVVECIDLFSMRHAEGWTGRISEIFVEKGWVDADAIVRRLLEQTSDDTAPARKVPPPRRDKSRASARVPKLEGPRWKADAPIDLKGARASNGMGAFSFCEEVLRKKWTSSQKVFECLSEALSGKPIDRVFVGRGLLSTGHLEKMAVPDIKETRSRTASKGEVSDEKGWAAMLGPVREPLSRWAFVLGVFSAILAPLTAIPAVVFGLTALRRVSGDRLPGRDRPLALTGILAAFTATLLWIAGGVLLLELPSAELDRAGELLIRADAFEELGALSEAVLACEEAVKVGADPKMKSQAYLKMGMLYIARGHEDMARAAFSRAIDLDPRVAQDHPAFGGSE